jgi:hypothetical protein
MNEILVITGLPRSGTSLMMQIIDKAAVPVLSDGKREKDISNPEGYFELEAVKGIVQDNSFLNDANGKAVKIVAPLPIYMNPSLKVSEREKFRTIYDFHLKKTYRFLKENDIPFLDVHYKELIADPEKQLIELIDFCSLNTLVEELAVVVKPELYRNRNEN